MSIKTGQHTYTAVLKVNHRRVTDPARVISEWPDTEEGSKTFVEVLIVRDEEVLTCSTGEPGPWMAVAYASARHWAGRMAERQTGAVA